MATIRRLAALGIAAPALYLLAVRPWHLRWGASDDEMRMPLPGDELIPNPASVSTRAITVRTAVEQVWPWVVQMGQGRGGLYSYELLENLVGSDLHNANRILPEFQKLRAGDSFRLASAERYPDATLIVDAVEPNRLLLLRSPNVGGNQQTPGGEFGYSWAFVLEPVDGDSTRFVSRARYQGPRAAILPLEALQFVMEREMLRGLKQRAEAGQDRLLDEVLPEYEFRGVETVTIHASPERIFRSLREVTLSEMPLAYALGTLRYLPSLLTGRMKRRPEETTRPFFEAGVMNILAETPGREMVIGTIGKLHDLLDQQFVPVRDVEKFRRFDDPDYEQFVQSFRIAGGSETSGFRLVAEHRTHALSPSARRKFALYWYLMVGWGGNWLLRMLLAAVKRRAERGGGRG